MLPDQVIALATEHRLDLLCEAAHRRLAARVAPPTPVRQRVGARLIALGLMISGERGGPRSTDLTR